MAALSIFRKIYQECILLHIFFNSASTSYLFLLIGVFAKGSEAVSNLGYASVCFTMNGPLKMLPHGFLVFLYQLIFYF